MHESTVRRLKAFGIAIHIPVALWAVMGFVIASCIFELEFLPSLVISLGCALLIYLVERLVMAMPKGSWVSLARVLARLVVAVPRGIGRGPGRFSSARSRDQLHKAKAE